MKEDLKLSGSMREIQITAMIKNGKREFTLSDAVDVCYPKGKWRPREVGRSVAWTLRNMMEKYSHSKSKRLHRLSGLGRGQKGVYRATGNGWNQ